MHKNLTLTKLIMLPSTNLKTHILEFTQQENRPPINLTEDKASAIRRFLHDKGATFIDLTDDNGDYLESIPRRIIRRVGKKEYSSNVSDYRWVCDYGTRHGVSEDCDCIDRFKFSGYEVLKYAKAKFGVQYAIDINESMQKHILERITTKLANKTK